MWQNWTNGILGTVIMVVALLGLSAGTLTWALLTLGAAVAVVGCWGTVTDWHSVSA